MKSYNNLYLQIISLENLVLAWKKARKGKTKKIYVIEFEKALSQNLADLHYELKYRTYKPKPLETFILRDPKTRKISKSDFRDRVIHHAVCNIIEPVFDKIFICDSFANRKGKGNLKAIERFYCFMRKVSRNGKIKGNFSNNQIRGYCLKADIKHYFRRVNHGILLKIIRRKIKDKELIWLIEQILQNCASGGGANAKSMPLGNLTSQFFANIYLNELDQFVKHKLRFKYYIRYVDDFVLLHSSKSQLENWKQQINEFLKRELKLELHTEKSRIIPLSKGIDFVGFRNFYYFRLPRKRNIRRMLSKIEQYENSRISSSKIQEIFQGWQAYVKCADTYRLRAELAKKIN